MFGFSTRELKVFGILCIAIFIVPFLFSPISTWQAGFWDYLNETPPIMWLGQLGWVILFAALGTIAVYIIKEVF